MHFIRTSCSVVLLAMALPFATAWASDGATPATSASVAERGTDAAGAVVPAPAGQYVRPLSASAATQSSFSRATPAVLEDMRGGSAELASDTRLHGATDGNSAVNVVTGNNVIQSGSFANAAGIPVVIQNSGANVLIQNATVVNLQFK